MDFLSMIPRWMNPFAGPAQGGDAGPGAEPQRHSPHLPIALEAKLDGWFAEHG